MQKLQELLNKNGFNLKVDGIAGEKTLAACTFWLQQELKKRNFDFPFKGLVWVRLDQTLTDTFDDIVCRVQGGRVDYVAPCSTTAGDYYIFNPITYMGVVGTAIACEQQVKNSHKFVTSDNWLGLWTKQPYFQQIRDVKIFRDGTKDRIINRDKVQTGNFGINFHRGWAGNRNWNASAGCQIVPDAYWAIVIKPFLNTEYIDFTLIEV